MLKVERTVMYQFQMPLKEIQCVLLIPGRSSFYAMKSWYFEHPKYDLNGMQFAFFQLILINKDQISYESDF